MKITISGSSRVCEAAEGETLLLALARSGLILAAPCGGRGRCGKCRVRLVKGQVSGSAPDQEGWVLACTAQALGDLEIALPGHAFEAIQQPGTELSGADRARKPGGVGRAGVALDIGTTTVSARLVDLDQGAPIDGVSELNDQRVFGADVMSRIAAAREGKTAELHGLINRQTKRIIEGFLQKWGLAAIETLSVSANTTMLHFFCNEDPSGMGEVPFTPVFLEDRLMSGEALGLPAGKVQILPSISAFVGGDLCGGLGVLDILQSEGPVLLVDIGTNGEMALFNQGSILCCATAAGPAFEGAEISQGMGGLAGAISGVQLIDGEISLTTIGEGPPKGICGSGLIDAVAVLLQKGLVDEAGYMEAGSFALSPEVSITARDIRQFQLAKSAIMSGIKILCQKGGLEPADIGHVYIAGGFGFFINKKNAVGAGLFPAEFLGTLSVSGNLSLQGAEEALGDGDFVSRCRRIIEASTVIDLSSDPGFMEEFAENMLFNVY
ncbi:MAG: ASKHA domain-containing protein [Treponema sp.]|nr:ASKHA domain-containing protein [Treponema sp.]